MSKSTFRFCFVCMMVCFVLMVIFWFVAYQARLETPLEIATFDVPEFVISEVTEIPTGRYTLDEIVLEGDPETLLRAIYEGGEATLREVGRCGYSYLDERLMRTLSLCESPDGEWLMAVVWIEV